MEEYKQKYEQALERAKEIHAERRAQPFDVATRIFPELKESEDERIRKELHEFCMKCFHGETIVNQKADFQRWATWLEKQGKQKSVWSEEDEKMWSTISDLLWEGYKLSDKKVSWDKIRCWLLPKIKSLKERMKGE